MFKLSSDGVGTHNCGLVWQLNVWRSLNLCLNFNFTCPAGYSQCKIMKIFICTLYTYIDMGKIEFGGTIISVQ